MTQFLIPRLEAGEPLVTVVVVPRERFRTAPASVECIIATADRPFRLVVVDGGFDLATASALRELSERHGFELIRTEGFLPPNKARNLGFARVKTPFVLFVDNDIVFRPGWMGLMLDCALETGAGMVGPLTLQGKPERGDSVPVHFAGGRLTTDNGRFEHHYPFENVPYREAAPQLTRAETGCVEFHAVLVRTELFQRIGGCDENLVATSEHFDLTLNVLKLGEKIMLEPAAIAINDLSLPLNAAERAYFCLRWSRRWGKRSELHFQKKWGVGCTMGSVGPFLRDHRLYAFPFRRWADAIGWRPMVLLVNLLSEAISLGGRFDAGRFRA